MGSGDIGDNINLLNCQWVTLLNGVHGTGILSVLLGQDDLSTMCGHGEHLSSQENVDISVEWVTNSLVDSCGSQKLYVQGMVPL